MKAGGYREARRLLTKRYGDDNHVASAYVDKLLQWQPIKSDDVTGLDELSIFMTGCSHAVDSSSYSASELNHPKTLRQVCEKLPHSLQDRWRRRVDRISEEEARTVLFDDLAKFIEDEARIQSNPLFGKPASHPKSQERMSPRSRRDVYSGTKRVMDHRVRTNLTMQVDAGNHGPQSCSFCLGPHSLEHCEAFCQITESERREFIMRNGICFLCLFKGHIARDCSRRARTGGGSTAPRSDGPPVVASLANSGGSGLPVVPVKLRFRGGPATVTYAFLDSGSSASFCKRSILDQLCVKGNHTQLTLSTVGGLDVAINSTLVTDLELQDLDENVSIPLPPIYSLDSIPVSEEDIPRREDVEQWQHLKEVSDELREVRAGVGLLIGVNVPTAMEPLDVVASQGGGPFAIKTRLGWVINGPTKQPSKQAGLRARVNRISITQSSAAYHEGIESLATDQCGLSVEDRRWLASVESECEMVDGHYSIPLPLKTKNVVLPNNKEVAMRRLLSLKKKFSDPRFAKEYQDFMQDMLDKGYAEEVAREDQGRNDGRVWYLPHHAVQNPKKDKIRVVFDCASEYRGISLNEELLSGPNLTNPLLDVLVRFRQGPVAFAADLEAMFYQVKVPEADRDFLRFLWWSNGDVNSAPSEYRMTVHLFGASSSPSCASFALRRSALDFGDDCSAEAKSTVLSNFYVDDCLCSTGTEGDAVRLAGELRSLCARGGFRLTKFVSNSRSVLASVRREDRGKRVKELNLNRDHLPAERVLGVRWVVEADMIGLEVGSVTAAHTRRSMLAVVGSMYDPIGLSAPVILTGRLVIQELARQQIRWDDAVPAELQARWNKWASELHLLSQVKIRRCLVPPGFGTIASRELHHFSDASSQGYGTVSYLRMVNYKGETHASFLFGKSRLAPIKGVSIPRLELTAATLSVRVNDMLQRCLQLPVDRVVYWTDSTAVLRYIYNERTRFHVFVSNRLAIIHDGSSPQQWRYVSSHSNPADVASRGTHAALLKDDWTWLRGPDFLQEDESEWPELPEGMTAPLDGDPEVKRTPALCAVVEAGDPVNSLVEHYSSWARLRRAVAWIIRLKTRLLKKVRQMQDNEEMRSGQLAPEELEAAEAALVRNAQERAYPAELARLRASDCVSRTSSIAKLDPFLEDGLIKVGGRLSRAGGIPRGRRHPIILPRSGTVVDFIIKQVHETVGHGGREHVLSTLREKYWVVKGSAAVRRVLGRCFDCRRRLGSVSQQKMADLPSSRVAVDEPPFTHTGVDYFGPFLVKRGRGHIKRYGVIFTCLTCRAVHLEVAESLTTDSFICALRRFVTRRGNVKSLTSDQGTNFVGASRELERELEELRRCETKIHATMLDKGIEWRFNPPGASNFGGAWERLIRSARATLEALLGQQTLTDELLMTLLCEVEAILNSRPLSVVSSDHRDPRPLSPNDLLLLGGGPVPPPGVFRSQDLYCNRRWRQCQYLADQFWIRWKKECSGELQKRQRWLNPHRNLTEDDIVLVTSETTPRCSWPLGRVVQVKKSDDGLVRSVDVLSRGTVLKRPVNKLVLLSDVM